MAIRHGVAGLAHASSHFVIFYLLVHGILKSGIAVNLLRGRRWIFAPACVILAGFIFYMGYHATRHFSWWLLGFALFDLLTLALVINEWAFGRKSACARLPALPQLRRAAPGRQHQGNACARARLGFHLQFAAMHFGQGPRNRQAQPGALMLARDARIDLAVGRHGGGDIGFAHADAGVGNGDAQATQRCPAPCWTVTRPPAGVNLMALDSRLSRICLSSLLSALIAGNSAPGKSSRPTPDFWARSRTSEAESAIRADAEIVSSRRSTLPASILDRSRILLIRVQEMLAAYCEHPEA